MSVRKAFSYIILFKYLLLHNATHSNWLPEEEVNNANCKRYHCLCLFISAYKGRI